MFGLTRAPDFDRAGLTWFNVQQPLTLASLKGRLVVLDFWTFCCINCLHVLPTLKRLEEAFPNELTVIGVHSPKFEHERSPQAVAQALARYDVTHPVVHDPHMTLWREYAIRAWPTLVFLSPDGQVIGELAGEPHPDLLFQGVGDMIRQFVERGELTPTVPFPLPVVEQGAALRFPSKIKPCPSWDGVKRWAVADTGHHQIVVLEDNGTEVARYGSGLPGFLDGHQEAAFNAPEGLACDQDFIYVADTRNHALRRIDRARGTVATLAGQGRRGGILRHPEPAAAAVLASPTDVVLAGDTLYFANAGTHQLGQLSLSRGQLIPVAGNGGENIIDGPAAESLLAQPSALAMADDGCFLYFTDSETSSLRRVVLASKQVETLVGTGLFDFGHNNGGFTEARLQHPLGLAVADGRIFVADSYNDTIRVIDSRAKTIEDVAPLLCHDALCRPLDEPAGVVADGANRLLVSDTNNHRIVEYRLDERTSRTWFG